MTKMRDKELQKNGNFKPNGLAMDEAMVKVTKTSSIQNQESF